MSPYFGASRLKKKKKKPFSLYVHKRLGQSSNPKIGSCAETSVLFFKTTGPMAQGWPQSHSGHGPHSQGGPQTDFGTTSQSLYTSSDPGHVRSKGTSWLTGGKLTQYQALLLETLDLTLRACQTLNPATVLPSATSKVLEHTYVKTLIEWTYKIPLWETQMRSG